MDAQQNLPRLPSRGVKFRVLIIGRANAGKTSILQRVCDTTESPVIYRRDQSGTRERVRSRFQLHFRSHCLARFNISTLQQRLDRVIFLSDGRS
jgi:GTPase SAR1 family protein